MSTATRTWVAVVLCMGVWFGYQKFLAPPLPQPVASTSTESGTVQPGPGAPIATAPTGTLGKPVAVVETERLKTTTVDLGLSDVGGKISAVRLLAYHETAKNTSPNISVVDSSSAGTSLGTDFSDPELHPFNAAAFTHTTEGNKVQFVHKDAKGVSLTKTYTVPQDGYIIDATYLIQFPANAKRDWGYLLMPVGGPGNDYDAGVPVKAWETAYFQNDSLSRKTVDKMDLGDKVFQGTSAWLAYGNRYFTTAILNNSTWNPDVVLSKDSNFVGGWFRYPVVLKEGQNQVEYKVRYFVGPKDHVELSKVPTLMPLIDFGFFKMLGFPLLWLLKFFYGFVHNYGVAIILLTLTVRLAVYPLALKSYKSMKSMQKLQPQIAALKERCGDDKEKFGREQIALFKAHKINPLGGCLPILVQMPVFFALYSVLANSIELFHAPFFGWIQDLATKDPYYVFPVLVGVAMFVQQRLTPMVGMDPIQQKMMMLMPLIFVVPTLSLPAGLAIYWFSSSLMGIIQQYSMTRDNRVKPTSKVISAGSAPEKS